MAKTSATKPQDDQLSDDELRRITGINPAEEARMESAAGASQPQSASPNNIAGTPAPSAPPASRTRSNASSPPQRNQNSLAGSPLNLESSNPGENSIGAAPNLTPYSGGKGARARAFRRGYSRGASSVGGGWGALGTAARNKQGREQFEKQNIDPDDVARRADAAHGMSDFMGSQGMPGTTTEEDRLREMEEAGNEAHGEAVKKGSQYTGDVGEDLYNAEKEGGKSPFSYTGDKGSKGKKDKLEGAKKNMKRYRMIAMIGGIIGALVSGLVSLIIFFLPHHLQTVVELARAKAMAAPNQAISEFGKVLTSYYIKNVAVAAITDRCPTTRRDRSCTFPISSSTNPVLGLYDKWHQKNLEGKWANKYNIVFARDNAGRIFMTAPGLPTNGVDIQEVLNGNTSIFNLPAVSQSDARQALSDAIRDETLWKRVWLRFQMRTIMQKYGIRRCIIACEVRDTFHETYDVKIRAAKHYLIERVIEPHSATLGLALQCIVNSGCDPSKTADNNGIGGAKRTQFEIDVQGKLAEFRAKYGQETLDKLIAHTDEVLKKGYTRYLAEQLAASMVGKFGGDEAAKVASKELVSKGIPIIGWAILAAQVIQFLNDTGPKLKALQYVATSQAMISTWSVYQTVADESRSGNMDAAMAGSFATLLSDDVADKNGNKSNVEDTPLYDYILNDAPGPTALETLLPTASAASVDGYSANFRYKCDNNKPIELEKGKRICDEEDPRAETGASSIANDLGNIIPDEVSQLAGMLTGPFGSLSDWVFGSVSEVAAHIPGYTATTEGIAGWIGKVSEPLIQLIQDALLRSPLSFNPSGGRTGTMIFGGAAVAANEFGHYMLGGKVLSQAEIQKLTAAQAEDDRQEFARLPFSERLLSRDNPHSLLSRVSLSLDPNLRSSIPHAFTNILSDPFGKLTRGLASILTTKKSTAAGYYPVYPGVTMHGLTLEEIAGIGDPATYWERNCANGQQNTKWNELATQNPDTYDLENTTINRCRMIETGVQIYGATYGVPQPL